MRIGILRPQCLYHRKGEERISDSPGPNNQNMLLHFRANDKISITRASAKIRIDVKIFQLCNARSTRLSMIHSESRIPWRNACRTVARYSREERKRKLRKYARGEKVQTDRKSTRLNSSHV